MTAFGLPPEVDPTVAAVIGQAQRLQQVLDDQLYKMKTESFTATDESGTVSVTLDGYHQLTDVFIEDGSLRQGAQVVQQRLNEALSKAKAEAEGSINDDHSRLNAVIAEISGDLQQFLN